MTRRTKDQEAIMKAPLNLAAHALIVSIFLAASIFAKADEARVKVAVAETSRQTIGPAGEQQGPPRSLQVAQQCRSGRNDCMTRPQEQCGPGMNGCLSLGQADCKARFTHFQYAKCLTDVVNQCRATHC
jgi:hypothetical protein